MRNTIRAAVLVVMALAGSMAKADEAGIRAVIGAQIEAFLADDFGTAFDFASPGIRSMFGTPERFGQMVRQGYPMVWRPGSVRYLELREEGGRPVQRVMIVDAEGELHLLDYIMQPGADGWKINGVYLLQAPAAGA